MLHTPPYKFLSTLSLRRATTGTTSVRKQRWISIHALLAESDTMEIASRNRYLHFYPRSPCGERQDIYIIWECMSKFLSTLSLRRATLLYAMGYYRHRDFYPRSPCGERPITDIDFRIIAKISIHALLAESDAPRGPLSAVPATFLSTLSLRRATGILGRRVRHGQQFLSTLSLRRATLYDLRALL